MNDAGSGTNVMTRRDLRYSQLSELSINYEGETEDIVVRPPDLSPHGMFLNTHRDFPEGAVLKLKFRLARSGVLINARCEVRYCLRGVGVGVEFIDIAPDAVHAIDEEISARSTSD
jgi:hypothetical protein